MKIKVEIDSEDLLKYTSAHEDRELAKELMYNLKDEDLVNEVLSREIVSDVLDELSERELEEIMAEYGFVKDKEDE